MRRLHFFFFAVAALLAASYGASAEQGPGVRRFDFVPQESSVTFSASSTLHDFQGKAAALEGFAELDTDRPAETAAGRLVVRAKSMTTDDKWRDDAMAEALETERHPDITFVLKSARVLFLSDDRMRGRLALAGDLSIHGVTKAVEIMAIVAWTGAKIEIMGSKELSLADYGIHPKSFLFLKVHDKVVVSFDVVGREKPATLP